MDIVLFVLLILTILILSGIASSSEAAILSMSYAKIKEIENSSKRLAKKAQNLIKVKEDIQKYISTIVILNNIINIVGSIYVGFVATKLFGEVYLGLVSGVLTFLIIIFSEIIPKIYGDEHSKDIALNVAGPLIFITKIFSPILFVVNKITTIFIKKNQGKNFSEGEIREMAYLGHKEGSINTYESDVIANVFKMNDIEVYDIMVPKNEVQVIDHDMSFDDIVKIVEKSGNTRFPVMKEGEVIGLINVKDLFRFYKKKTTFSINKILRPIIYAPESMKIFTLEEKIKKKRNHMAIVVNEHGDFTGIVTLEDIIEELLGDIEDEFDTEEKLFKKVSENIYIVDGGADIFEINEEFNLELAIDENDDFTTVNGYLTTVLGKIPKVNDKIKTEKCKFRILKANRKKALEVEMYLKL